MNGPPPPPHGTKPNTTEGAYRSSSDLPQGNYDIFVIPPHSSGSGFLYLPSLQCQRNSFIAGCLCTLFAVLLYSTLAPVLKTWYNTTIASGSGSGLALLAIGVGVAGWAFGASQADSRQRSDPGSSSSGPGTGGTNTGGTNTGTGQSHSGPSPDQRNQHNQHNAGNKGPNPNEWDRAREETRRKEELRRKMEEINRKREADAKTAKETATKESAKKEADAKFAALKEAAAKKYAEKMAKDTPKDTPEKAPRTPSPKKPPFPTARTATDEDDAYSFRPYDRPKRHQPGPSGSSTHSGSSFAYSHSTAATTPPPSHRGPYSTKDPDKIVIRGVYAFNNVFPKTPTAQLVSGEGMVTDGLVLRITTEGLFIDDDVRGIPQREWDVKAWTMKSAEVWCPQNGAGQSHHKSNPFHWGTSTAEASDAYLANLLKVCKNTCRLAPAYNAGQQSLHVLRACLRDQEGNRYVFVLQEAEGWKVAVGLQRLRQSTQIRQFGVSSISAENCRSLLGGLGYV